MYISEIVLLPNQYSTRLENWQINIFWFSPEDPGNLIPQQCSKCLLIAIVEPRRLRDIIVVPLWPAVGGVFHEISAEVRCLHIPDRG